MTQAIQWWVYLLRCADGTLYTGITKDPARRLEQHNEGSASRYTRARLPVAMIWREPIEGHGEALRREAAIKKLSREAKETLAGAGAKKRPRKRKPDK